MPAAEASSGEIDGEIDDIRKRILADELSVARAFLGKLHERKWDSCTPRQRFRIHTLLADVEAREDHHAEAARHLIAACEFQPDDAVARANEVAAYELLGDPARAHTLAADAAKRFATSVGVAAAWARTAPSDDALTKILDDLPAHLARNSELWADLGVRIERVESLAIGETLARKATTLAPDDARSWLALGLVLFRSEVQKRDPETPPDRMELDEARLTEADTCFTRAKELAQKLGGRFVALALLRRSTLRAFREDETRSHADIDEAQRIAPNDPAVKVQYARSLGERGNVEACIRVLREVHAKDPESETEFLLGMMLCERNQGKDRTEGADLLSTCARRPGPHADAACLYGVEALLSVGRIADAIALLDAVAHADGALVAVMRARVAFEQKDTVTANVQATASVGSIGPTTSRDTLRKIGKVLLALGRFDESFQIWDRLAPGGVGPIDDVRALVDIAAHTKRHSIVLETCAAFRALGRFDAHLVEAEAQVLSEYDPSAAIDLMKEMLAHNPNDKRSRLNLALLALYVPRSDVEPPPLESLPRADEATAQEGAGVVYVLLRTKRVDDAQSYAYDLLRSYPRDVLAHRAFLQAMAPRASAGENAPEKDTPDIEMVTAGTAVSWVEDGAEQERVTVIEDSTSPAVGAFDEEVSPTSALAKAFLGKRAGDTTTLATGAVQDRRATIKSIVRKYTFRVRDVFNNWQLRFPEEHDVAMFRALGPDGQFDVGPLLRLAEQNQKRTEQAEQLYRTQPLSVGLFARALGVEEIPALMHLATSDDAIVRCCLGTAEEDAAAIAAYREAREIVVDPSAFATLLLLGRLDALDATDKTIVISYGTFNTLQALARDAKTRQTSEGSLGVGPKGPGLFVATPETKEAAVRETERLVELARTKWRVEHCRSLASIDRVVREQLFQGFGAAAVQSAAIAGAPQRLLWTDDLVTAVMAKQHFGAPRTWTQTILRRLVAAGKYRDEHYIEASIGLLAMRYHFTSVTPDIFRRAAGRANWVADRAPLKQALDYIASPHTRIEDAVPLATTLIVAGYRENEVPDMRRRNLIAVANAVARRPDARRAIALLQVELPRSFTLDVLNQADAVATLATWRKLERSIIT